MDTLLRAERVAVDTAISENVATLIHRARTTQTAVAESIGMSRASMSRKMDLGPWHYAEMLLICESLDVTVEELAGTLPSLDEWRARRDSNPKPSDLCPAAWPALRLVWSVRADLTPDRLADQRPATALRSVS